MGAATDFENSRPDPQTPGGNLTEDATHFTPFPASGQQEAADGVFGNSAAVAYHPTRRFVQRVSILAWTVAATVAVSLFLRLPTVV